MHLSKRNSCLEICKHIQTSGLILEKDTPKADLQQVIKITINVYSCNNCNHEQRTKIETGIHVYHAYLLNYDYA